MMPRRLGVYASAGLASLGALATVGCATSAGPAARHSFHPPMFAKPADADAFSAVLIARYAALNNDPAEAVAQYASVLDELPDGDPIAARGVYAALMSGDFDRAVAFARKASAGENGGSSLSRLTLAVDTLVANRPDRAIAHLSSERFGPFNRSMAISLAAWIAFEEVDLSAALGVLRQAGDDAFAVQTVTLAMEGLLQVAAREDDLALATFERLDAMGPRLAIATDAQARLMASRGDTAAAFERIDSFTAEVGRNPKLTQLRRSIATGEAVDVPRLSSAEGAALGLYASAAALAARSDSDLPGVYFALALKLDPSLDAARTLWADTLDRNGRFVEAAAVLEQVPAHSPFYAAAQAQRAWAVASSGEMDRALTIAADAVGQTADRDLRVQYGDLLATNGDDAKASEVFTAVIAEDARAGREDWRLFLARGAILERLGAWERAEADLVRSLELAPDNPDVMNRLGGVWIDQKSNLDAAVPMLEKAAALRPEAGPIIDSLGWAYFHVGRYHDAMTTLERAVSLSPTSATVNDHLGDAYWRLGRHREATFQWTRALELDPEEARAIGLRRKLVAGLPPRTAGLVGASLSEATRTVSQP
ncbi:MAG: hypothetical protein AAGJ32_05190 [Pseudomonadota bacterium]